MIFEVDGDVQLSYLKLGEVYWNKFQEQPKSDHDKKRVEYSFIWRTDKVAATERKHRSVLPCVIKLKRHEEIRFVVLVKFYDEINDNHIYGTPLKFLTLNCEDEAKQNYYKMVFNGPEECNVWKF